MCRKSSLKALKAFLLWEVPFLMGAELSHIFILTNVNSDPDSNPFAKGNKSAT